MTRRLVSVFFFFQYEILLKFSMSVDELWVLKITMLRLSVKKKSSHTCACEFWLIMDKAFSARVRPVFANQQPMPICGRPTPPHNQCHLVCFVVNQGQATYNFGYRRSISVTDDPFRFRIFSYLKLTSWVNATLLLVNNIYSDQ